VLLIRAGHHCDASLRWCGHLLPGADCGGSGASARDAVHRQNQSNAPSRTPSRNDRSASRASVSLPRGHTPSGPNIGDVGGSAANHPIVALNQPRAAAWCKSLQ
jgi:hypothetical protein